MPDRDLSSYPLNEAMEFDHVVEVHPDGRVTDGPPNPPRTLWAPELLDEQLSGDGNWTLLDGYSGQDRYSGPVMHNSEYIGGRMERDILAQPGYYVAIVATWTPKDDEDDEESPIVEGWAVAYQPKADGLFLDADGRTRWWTDASGEVMTITEEDDHVAVALLAQLHGADPATLRRMTAGEVAEIQPKADG